MRTALLLAAALAAAGCTSQQLAHTGQQWHKQQCQQHKDLDERKRCEASAEQARAETEGKRK